MFTLSNFLSFVRAPLALLFLQENVYLRALSILLAMFTDSIDGYVARRSQSASKLGAILDPTMDKFFVYFALFVFFYEGRIHLSQVLIMLSRDFFLFLFGLYLIFSNKWKNYIFHAIRWGKVTTTLQFCVLLGLTFHYAFSWYVYSCFILFSLLAFFELFQTKSVLSVPSDSNP
jgi:CDP-diacylglycerol---glycerol-3-phosphate 3-phosphatidyltransferase